MVRFIFLTIACSALTLGTEAQLLRKNICMPMVSMNAYGNKNLDIFSFVANQANLARMDCSGAGIYSEQRFMLRDLSANSMVAVLNTKNLSFGLQFNHIGNANFNEQMYGVAMGKKLSDKIDVGAQFNLLSQKASFYRRFSMLFFETGAIFHLSPILNIGIHFQNPAGLLIKVEGKEKIPSVYSFGLGYAAADDFFLGIEINKEENLPAAFKAGVQYNFKKNFIAGFGYTSNTEQIYFGAGVALRKINVGAACTSHPQLGTTPGISLSLRNK